MSANADVETQTVANVVAVPIQSVTIRMPKSPPGQKESAEQRSENRPPDAKVRAALKKQEEAKKPSEVVFLRDGDKVRTAKVKRGISDDNYVEILDGLREGGEVVSGGYKAINRELEDGRKIKIGKPASEVNPEKK